jgi:hypothetical protein
MASLFPVSTVLLLSLYLYFTTSAEEIVRGCAEAGAQLIASEEREVDEALDDRAIALLPTPSAAADADMVLPVGAGCAAAVPSCVRSMLTEIYLCKACSCHFEILSGNGAAAPDLGGYVWTIRVMMAASGRSSPGCKPARGRKSCRGRGH